jgi:hypothetical protein
VVAEATAINAMASGSRQSTMRAINHRIARSLSVSSPTDLGHVADRCGFHRSRVPWPPTRRVQPSGLLGDSSFAVLLVSEHRRRLLLSL